MAVDRPVGLRPCHVYDYDGDYLGSFNTWSAAHEWAHLQAAMGGVQGPLELEDERVGQRRRIWVDRCAENLETATLCDVLDGPTFIPTQPRSAD